jgi:branched-chain amino acid transport system substrate-binding protein
MATEKIASTASVRAFTAIAVVALIIVTISLYFVFNYTGYASLEGKQKVSIGAILPLTGSLSITGESLKKGMVMAAEEVNNRSLSQLEFFIENSEGDAQKAVTAYHKLVSVSKVPIITDAYSRELAAIIPLSKQDGVVVLSQLALSSFIDKAGENVFKLAEKNIDLSQAIVKTMKIKQHANISFLILDDEYCVDAAQAMKESLAKENIHLLVEEHFSNGATDVRTQLFKIKDSKPEAVYICGFYRDLSLAFKQAREIGLKTQFYTSTTVENKEVIKAAGKEAVEGVIYSRLPYDCKKETTKVFCENFKARYGKEPDYPAAYGYDTIMIIIKAAERVIASKKSVNAENIQKELLKIHDYHGATGIIDFDEAGNVKRQVEVKTIRDGEFAPLNV